MLTRKLRRELKSDLGMCICVIVLSFLAVATYLGFNGDVIGFRKTLESFKEHTHFADGWIYSEGFSQEELQAVKDLPFVEDAQLRTCIKGSAPAYGNAQTDIYLEEESTVIVPEVVEGSAFDPSDTEGVWLNASFADAWNIRVGDAFTFSYEGVSVTKEVRGLIMTPEYIYTCADNDADTNLANLAYVYIGKSAFPVREFMETAIDNGNITPEDLEDAPENIRALLGTGISLLPKAVLKSLLAAVSDEDLLEYIPATTLLFTTNTDADVMTYEDEIADALKHNYAAMVNEHMVLGLERFVAETQQHEMFSYTFAAVFVLIAVMIIATSMARLVERQRVQIGTLNALGYRRGRITFHYVSYSLFLAAAGAVLGFLVGLFVFANAMIRLFSEYYVLPEAKASFDGMSVLVILLTVGACALSSFLACRKILHLPPATALRPAAPPAAKKTLFEKLPFWKKLGFASRYDLRDISRYKFRALMGIVGTACGMLCAVFAFGCIGLVDDIDNWVFDRIQNYSYEASLSGNAGKEWLEKTVKATDGELVMQTAIEISRVGKNVSSADKTTQTLTVIEGKDLYRLTDAKANVLTLRPGETAITCRLAKTLGVNIGDTVYWHLYMENTWYESVIGAISRSPETPGIAMLREDLEKTGCKFTPTLLASDSDLSFLREDANVNAVYEKEELRQIFLEGYEVVNLLVYFMLIVSLILIVVVLYNAGNMSFHERLKEFATLKVMGLSDAGIRRVLTLENIWLSVLGILAGIPFARPLLVEMMNSNGENFDYYISIGWQYYIISGAFVLLVTCLVGYLFNKKIRRLDMVETLKGAE